MGTAGMELIPQRGQLVLDHRRPGDYDNDNDNSLVGLDVNRRYIHGIQSGCQHLDDVGAENAPSQPEAAAAKIISADGYRQNGIHLNIDQQGFVVELSQTAHADQAGYGNADTQQHETQKLNDRGVDAVESRGTLIDTYRLCIEAQTGKPEDQCKQQPDR